MKQLTVLRLSVIVLLSGCGYASFDAAAEESNPIIDLGKGEEEDISKSKDDFLIKEISESQSSDKTLQTIVTDKMSTQSKMNSKTIHEDQEFKLDEEIMPGFLNYHNPQIGISIQYPSFWDVDNHYFGSDSVRFISPLENKEDQYYETFDIVAYYPGKKIDYYVSADTSIEEIAHGVIQTRNSSAANIEIRSANKTNIGENPALYVIYTYNDPHIGNTEALELIIKAEDRFYDIVYYAKPETFEYQIFIVDKMLDSIRLAR